ncbi:MAG: phosphate ABC transporter permease subunit PstC [Sphingomonadales bacterium]|nr:phosphate ABC transporter permease subunit PstC [Sphingomonadales bacterium]
MSPAISVLLALALGLAAWLAARARAWTMRKNLRASGRDLASLPNYHAWYAALWTAVPATVFATAWAALSPRLVAARALADPAAAALPGFGFQRDAIVAEAQAIASGQAGVAFNSLATGLVAPFREAMQFYGLIGIALTLVLALAGGTYALVSQSATLNARTRVEQALMMGLLAASLIAILTTFGILASLAFETMRFFQIVSPVDFLFGTNWTPDPMSGVSQGLKTNYGAVPLFWGTVYVGAIIAMIVAIPLGLMSAIFLTQYASQQVRSMMKPVLEILAGVPTVVYGYFAALTVAPAVRDLGHAVGIASASSESALAAGLVMGVMIIPLVSSMADDSIAAVPQAMRDGSLAMGATKSETIRKVLLPAALPGIVAGVMLAVSRAIGETMIVVMAAGAIARLTANPFQSITTVTYQIVAMLTGEGSFDHPATLSAFALGFVLFLVTLTLNFIALRVVKRFREAYE